MNFIVSIIVAQELFEMGNYQNPWCSQCVFLIFHARLVGIGIGIGIQVKAVLQRVTHACAFDGEMNVAMNQSMRPGKSAQ